MLEGGAKPYGCGMLHCILTHWACGTDTGHGDSRAWSNASPTPRSHEFRVLNCPSRSMLGEGESGLHLLTHQPLCPCCKPTFHPILLPDDV